MIPKLIMLEKNSENKKMKRPLSIKLFTKLIIERCSGDFCNYVVVDNNQFVASYYL